MDQVANRYVNVDPEGAAAWAERYAGEDYAARVIEEVGDEWAEQIRPTPPRQAQSKDVGR